MATRGVPRLRDAIATRTCILDLDREQARGTPDYSRQLSDVVVIKAMLDAEAVAKRAC